MIYLGVFCFIYYMVIQVYTKRRNSTFLLFWFIAGMVCLILAWMEPYYPIWLQRHMWVFLIPWCVFVVIEIFICSAMFQVADRNLGCIIVLGAQIRGTTVTNSLERRLEKAIEYLSDNPGTVVIVSGGQGKEESITEAEAMAAYLTEHGIDRARILLEMKSTSTDENLRFSSELIDDISKPVGIVTNNFHMYRAMRTAKKLGYQHVEGISASSNPVLFLNYMVREFFACFYHLILKK